MFSLEISGPKVVLVLLCKFSLYRAVGALWLQPHLMDDPALSKLKIHLHYMPYCLMSFVVLPAITNI